MASLAHGSEPWPHWPMAEGLTCSLLMNIDYVVVCKSGQSKAYGDTLLHLHLLVLLLLLL
jgi:hypothetical protein